MTFDARTRRSFLPCVRHSCSEEAAVPTTGALGALIDGELVFPGAEEFGVNDWRIVPEPRANEVRVAYVFTTHETAESRNPSPDPADTIARVLEASGELGVRGYHYRIFARPAGLAVYALAGIERTDTVGVHAVRDGPARDVVTSPGEENDGVDVMIDIPPRNRELSVELATILPGPPWAARVRVEGARRSGGEA